MFKTDTGVYIVAQPSTVVLPARGSASCSCPAALPMATRLLPAGALSIRTPPGKSAYIVEALVATAVTASLPCDDRDLCLVQQRHRAAQVGLDKHASAVHDDRGCLQVACQPVLAVTGLGSGNHCIGTRL